MKNFSDHLHKKLKKLFREIRGRSYDITNRVIKNYIISYGLLYLVDYNLYCHYEYMTFYPLCYIKMKKTYEELLREMQNNPIYQEIDKICKENDYELKVACKNYYGRVDINIIPQSQERHYQPDIYFYWNTERKEGHFEIGAWSLGSLGLEDFEKIIKGNNQAMDVAKRVSELDVNGLFQYPYED